MLLLGDVGGNFAAFLARARARPLEARARARRSREPACAAQPKRARLHSRVHFLQKFGGGVHWGTPRRVPTRGSLAQGRRPRGRPSAPLAK